MPSRRDQHPDYSNLQQSSKYPHSHILPFDSVDQRDFSDRITARFQ
jgi:hypothetical protein